MLNIKSLRSQKQLVQHLIAEGFHLIYCYLRSKDSKTARLGTPYYIGIASIAQRPYMKHEWKDANGRRRMVPVPKDEALIRIMDVLETRHEALQREQYFIALYGRRFINPCGILINRGAGGGSGSYGNRVPRRRVAQWSYVKETAARLSIPPEVYVRIPRPVRIAYKQYCLRYPKAEVGIIKFRDKLYTPNIDSKNRNGWRVVGAPKDAWDSLSTSQKEVAFERHTRGMPWNFDCRRNPSSEDVAARLASSLRAKHLKGAEILKMPVEVYASLTPSQRYEMKKWLKVHPGSTWDKKPKGNNPPSGAAHSGLVAAANKYGIDINLYASLSDKERRNLHRRYIRGWRDEDLLKPLIENDHSGSPKHP